MNFTTDRLKALIMAFSEKMARERDYLCALDGAIGDGDHGIAMAQGMSAAALAAQQSDGTLQDICNAAAKGFLNAVGASSGPLYATGLLRAGKFFGPVATVSEDRVPLMIVAIRDGIVHRGKAEPGQKTMLDAWHPAAEAALRGETTTAIARTAWAGAEATKSMIAGIGRAERLGERSLGHPDPGAISAAMLIEEIVRS